MKFLWFRIPGSRNYGKSLEKAYFLLELSLVCELTHPSMKFWFYNINGDSCGL